MTLQQLKCAVEVWKCGSINKAAERLYMNQPNISRLIKNLESEFNLVLFSRTSSGMEATGDGKMFLTQAEKLVKNTDTFERSFKNGLDNSTTFRIALPRGSYLTKAFANTLNTFPRVSTINISYNETNNEEIISCVSSLGYDVGIIRLPIEFESSYKKILAEKHLKFKKIMTFRFVVVMRKDHPLAGESMFIYPSFPSILHSCMEIIIVFPFQMRKQTGCTARNCTKTPSPFLIGAVNSISCKISPVRL